MLSFILKLSAKILFQLKMCWVDFCCCCFYILVVVVFIVFAELFIWTGLKPIFTKRQMQTPQSIVYVTYWIRTSVIYLPPTTTHTHTVWEEDKWQVSIKTMHHKLFLPPNAYKILFPGQTHQERRGLKQRCVDYILNLIIFKNINPLLALTNV